MRNFAESVDIGKSSVDNNGVKKVNIYIDTIICGVLVDIYIDIINCGVSVQGGCEMNNNDILIRFRYALDIKDTDMIEIFKLGGTTLTREELQRMLLKPKKGSNIDSEDDEFVAADDMKKCNNYMLESFLNGFILLKRGKQETKPGEPEKQAFMIRDNKDVNNILLKKLKIALSLTSDDMLEILKVAGLNLSNSELSSVLRREGQRNYRECGDKYIRYFLKGLAIKYRDK